MLLPPVFEASWLSNHDPKWTNAVPELPMVTLTDITGDPAL
jgi:hypothetical protein